MYSAHKNYNYNLRKEFKKGKKARIRTYKKKGQKNLPYDDMIYELKGGGT